MSTRCVSFWRTVKWKMVHLDTGPKPVSQVPCPYCGNQSPQLFVASYWFWSWSWRRRPWFRHVCFIVQCGYSPCSSEGPGASTREEAIVKWETRPSILRG